MTNIPRNADYARRKRDENMDRAVEDAASALKNHIRRDHERLGWGALAPPPDPVELAKQANGRIDALRWRLADEKKQEQVLTESLAERVSRLETELKELRAQIRFQLKTDEIWGPSAGNPDDN